MDGAWWLLQSSKLARPDYVGSGGFDSHTLPPPAPTTPTLPVRPLSLRAFGAALVALALHASPLASQQRDTTAARRPGAADSVRADSVRRDSVRADSVARARRPAARPRRAAPSSAIPDSLLRPPISPRRAFLYSLAIPGQGQVALRRKRAAALFGAVEVGSIFMLLKSENDLRIARAHVADSVFLRFDPPPTGSTDSLAVYEQDRLAVRVRARRLHVEDWMAALIFNHLISGADAFVAAQLWDLPAQVSFQPAPRGLAVNASIAW